MDRDKNNTLEYKGFVGSVEFSNEDNCLFGEILGISDLVTYEAKDVGGLKAAFHDMGEDYIKTCEMVGKDPEKSC
jgi:predicted HicB family RNase H-like nuclease